MERPLTQHIDLEKGPLDIEAYEAAGGYEAVRKVLGELTPEEVIEEVKKSNLKGRGGAGFPTGIKWSFVPMGEDAPKQKYLVANGDEMEPGTFKDRVLLEGDPHMLVEGMILSAYAIQANTGYVFLRWAYKASARAVRKAIEEAYEAGYIGKDILDSGFDFDLRIHTSVGRYMCGEETGLLNALEGRRARPRAKPPYPQNSGLFGKPTIVNNIETLCCVPHILKNGPEWFKDISATGEGGTKIYGVSGQVNNPGAWELPLGTPMREIIEDHAGGMKEGYQFKGALPGGASTDFLIPDHMDVPMDYDHITSVDSRLGTGTLIVLDDQTCPVGFVQNLEHFFAQESCGWCTPCRDGLPWIARILKSIDDGSGQMEDLHVLEQHTKGLGPGMTFCALAPGAMEPLQSALKYFREDFERHIREQKCQWN